MPEQIFRVSYSSLGTFSACPRKFEFDKIYPKRARVGEDNYAAEVGQAMHAGFQDYLIHQDEDRAIWEFMRAFPYEGEYSQPNDYRGFDACLSTLEEMFKETKLLEYELARIKRPNTQEELDAGLTGGVTVPAIEVPFEIRFPGVKIPPCPSFPDGAYFAVIGFIDAIMRNHISGMFRTLDIKTSRMNLTDATGKYKFDTQQVPYGIVVDHVAQGNVDAFEVLYLDSYIDLVEPRVTLYPFIKTQADIQDWAVNKLIQFRAIAGFAATDYFPRTENGCIFYNRPCRYLEPCMSRDRNALMEWFLLGEEPGKNRDDDFVPWIVADVDME